VGFVFGTTWNKRPLWAKEAPLLTGEASAIPADRIVRVVLLYWREHCLERAPPEYYRQCPLYLARIDRKCVRVAYGTYPNEAFRAALRPRSRTFVIAFVIAAAIGRPRSGQYIVNDNIVAMS